MSTNEWTRQREGSNRASLQEELIRLRNEAARKAQSAHRLLKPRGQWPGPIPLSFAQERLWFLDQLGLVGPAYNIPLALSLTGELDEHALERSFFELVRRHETLRTRFDVKDGVPYQLIDLPQPFPLHRVDLSTLTDPGTRQNRLREHLRTEQQCRFDLAKGPLLRVVLIRLATREHSLLITMHHIVADGWSIGVMVRELSTLYASYVRGEESPLPDLPVQYADYAIWQKDWVQGDVLQRQLRYWVERLGDAPSELQLPTDRRRPAIESFRGATLTFNISNELWQRLVKFAQSENATAFMFVLAVYQMLLARYSGQEDVVVGSPIANRPGRAIEGHIGFFVNTIVLRTQVFPSLSFRELLRRVREITLGAYANQDMPFEALVKQLRPERTLTRQPLFQVWLALQNFPEERLELPGLRWEWTTMGWETSLFDLALYLQTIPNGMSAMFEYATDLFDEVTVSGMARHFQILVKEILARPDLPLSELSLLEEGERHRIVVEWNATDAPYSNTKLIHQLFEEQVERTPLSPAVLCGRDSLTYSQLNAKSNRLARYLIANGVGPDQRVAISVERSLDMVVGLMGILKAGGAYVPVDPNYPPERIQHMLSDSAPKLVLTQQNLISHLPSQQTTLAALDGIWEDLEQYGEGNIDPNEIGLHSSHLAYVIYTSGSTGRPKGAMNEHRALINRLQWMQDTYRLDTRDHVLQKTPFSFDVSVWEFFWTLMTGARLIVARPQGHQDPSYLMDLIEAAGVTTVHFVPSMLQLFLDQYNPGRCSTLRHVLCSGEELPASLARRFFECLPKARLHNLYGPTEAAIDVTYWECKVDDPSPRVPIGRPIWNTQMYVLDAHRRPVAIGTQGEIYIGGIGVGRGYLNQPELTEDRFIPNPFRIDLGDRMYKTGDLGRWRRDGAIEYLGRYDFQVKIRGFRIELGEIEAALMEHPAVKQVAIIARDDQDNGKRLVAYVVARKVTSSDQSTEELRGMVVGQWKTVYEETYSSHEKFAGPNFVGWNSTYTGQPIPEPQMQEWLTATIHRIRALRPQRILEIGCGVGLLLQHLAPLCSEYVGTDLSSAAIESLRSWTSRNKNLAHVELLHRSAVELEGFHSDAFDTVVLNSVVQYFPDIDYLLAVLRGAVRLVCPGGHIFIGDVRHLGLLLTFQTAVQLTNAAATVTVKQLRNRITSSVAQENELLVDPQFFRAIRSGLPRISAVEIHLKRGRAANELTRYRYDVILKVGDEIEPELTSECLDWSSINSTLEYLDLGLQKRNWSVLRLRRIPNERLRGELEARTLVDTADESIEIGSLRHRLSKADHQAVDPELLWDLASKHDYDVTLSPGEEGCFDALFVDRTRRNLAGYVPTHVCEASAQLHAYANNPLESGFRQQLIPKLREHLKARLPDYMVPAAFVFMQVFPLTPNGKLDRRALPAPDLGILTRAQYESPEGHIEQLLAALWQGLLQIDQVGRDDNFFELGGHSLLAIRVLQKTNSSFGCVLRVVDLYQSPTIRQLAARIGGLNNEEEFVDLSREATLPADIAPTQEVRPPQSPQAVLLTGCTGFVGRYLLAQLLEVTDARVYCLIRAKSEAEASRRARETLDKAGLWRDEFTHRIIPIRGDIRLPCLGLDAELYQNACLDVDSIYHCATSMNHLETYAMAKAANVDGVREILRIAVTAKQKSVNYVSTLGVFANQHEGNDRSVSELTSIDHERHKASQGYVASKWVGEKLLMLAAERGIACNIFRVGLVWADSELGRYDELQREDRFLRSCLLSGFGIKNYCYDPPPVPVDYVARAITWLANKHSGGGGVFHICSSQPPVRDLFERYNTILETPLQLLPFYEWVDQVKRLHNQGRMLPAVPLIESTFSMNETELDAEQRRLSSSDPRVECARTEQELRQGGILMPEFTNDLFSRYFESVRSEAG